MARSDDLHVAGAAVETVVSSSGVTAPAVVAICAAANGLDRVRAFFAGIPGETGVAFVVIQTPDAPNIPLAEALGQRLPVVAEPGVHLEPDRVHVLPGRAALSIRDGAFAALPLRRHPERRLDAFLRSLAEDRAEAAIAILMSYAGTDGIVGIKAIKDRGGLVIVQQPNSARAGPVARRAVATGLADVILPVEAMPAALLEYLRRTAAIAFAEAALDAAPFNAICDALLRRTGHDFHDGEPGTLRRRIRRRMAVRRIDSLSDYAAALRGDAGEIDRLFRDLLIGEPRFFRDPDTLAQLARHLLPRLAPPPGSPLRVWVPACGGGEEPYSLAILLHELALENGVPPRIQLFATDVDGPALEAARHGRFPAATARHLPAQRMARCFEPRGDSIEIASEIRDLCIFSVHDLLRDPPLSHMDVIACRNQLVHLERSLQTKVIRLFHDALRPGGILFLGPPAGMGRPRSLFRDLDPDHGIYQRLEDQAHRQPGAPGGAPVAAPARGGRRAAPPAAAAGDALEPAAVEEPGGAPAARLERELRETRERLQSAVAELGAANEELDRAHNDLRHLFRSTRIATIFLDQKLRIKSFTPAIRAVFRLMETDIGRPITDLASRSAVDTMIRDAERTLRTLKRVERTVRLENGAWYIMEIHAYRALDGTTDGVVITFVDVSELKQAERRAAHLASIVESSDDAIYGVTLDGTITSWNHAAERMYGYSAAAMVGGPIYKIVPEDRVDELKQAYERLRNGERVASFETVRTTKDGRPLHVSLTISPVYDGSGALDGASVIARDLTERKQAEDDLRRSEQELADFFENAPMGLHWVGQDGTILLANRAELEMLGYSYDEYAGHHLSEFYADPEQLDDMLARLKDGETLKDHDVRLRCKDGSIRHVVMSSNVRWEGGVFAHTRCFTRDVTEHKRAQRALVESEQRLSLALEVGRMGAWEWDLRSNRMSWSPTLESLHGLEAGTFGGRYEDFLRDIHPEDVARVRSAIDASLRERAPYHIQYRIRLPNGRIAWLEARGRLLLDARRRSERLVGVCIDVTERKHAEESLYEIARRKDEFLAMLGHELRNPLAPIQNCMQILRMPNASPDQVEKAWQMMARQVLHLGRLVDDLLDVSRISSGKILLRKERLDLTEIARDTIEDYQGVFDSRGIRLVKEICPVELWGNGDATRLSQALGNLLHNAAKFTDRGGTVTVTVGRERDAAVISVSDTGIGIPQQLLARLFEPFSQAASGLDRSAGGLGLGLTLVRAMVELHGGSVVASSAGLGKGARFIVRLPLEEGREPARRVGRPPDGASLHRVLLIEDNADAAESLRLLLEMFDHEVETAPDGRSGVEKARELRPDVVLCDIGLPGALDGYAVARVFREDPSLRSVYLVALTGYGQAEDQLRAREAGFDAHLTKPVGYEDLERLFRMRPSAPAESTS